MQPLLTETEDQLDIPAEVFNQHGLVVLIAQGGRYGGDWIIGLSCLESDYRGRSCGKMMTQAGNRKSSLVSDSRYPDMAIESLFSWTTEQVSQRRGWRIVYFANMNKIYSTANSPYFCAAHIIVASESFIPEEGVRYADDIPLKQMMGTS